MAIAQGDGRGDLTGQKALTAQKKQQEEELAELEPAASTEDPKKTLYRARRLQIRMEQLRAELVRIREMRSYITGTDFSAVRVKNSGGRGPVERIALSERSEKLERLLEAELERLSEAKIEAIGIISLLENQLQQDVLWEYYIHALRTWDDVAAQVGYSRRHVTRIHGEALEELRNFMSLNVPPDL